MTTGDDETIRAAALPQADASTLVDAPALEARVKEMYGRVSREQSATLHFEVGRALAEHLDIVSGRPLKERTRRNPDLWAACIAGAIPRASYLQTIRAAGLDVRHVRRNDYRFVSDRALDACSTYDVESISLLAVKP